MTFELNSYHLNTLRNKNKMIQTLSTVLTNAYFKVTKGLFTFYLIGRTGVFNTQFNIDYDGDETYYFSIDYYKWNIVLQKYCDSESIELEVLSNSLKIHDSNSKDSICLGINLCSESSSEVTTMNTFIDTYKEKIINSNKKLDISEKLLNNLSLANGLFISQEKINSIGLSKNSITYADRSIVFKAYNDDLPDELFISLEDGEDNIYIHSMFIRLFDFFCKTNSTVYFSDDYSLIYWSDLESSLVLESPDRDIALPTDEQFIEIQPTNRDSNFVVSMMDLSDGLEFFNGFYEASVWKPVRFDITNGEVTLNYQHPTTKIDRSLKTTAPYDGHFSVNSETLLRLITKIKDGYTKNYPITITYDEDAPGAYCRVVNEEDPNKVDYEFVISKIDDQEY